MRRKLIVVGVVVALGVVAFLLGTRVEAKSKKKPRQYLYSKFFLLQHRWPDKTDPQYPLSTPKGYGFVLQKLFVRVKRREDAQYALFLTLQDARINGKDETKTILRVDQFPIYDLSPGIEFRSDSYSNNGAIGVQASGYGQYLDLELTFIGYMTR